MPITDPLMSDHLRTLGPPRSIPTNRDLRGPGDERRDTFEIGDPGSGLCDSDGHYRCEECRNLSYGALEHRRQHDDSR